jgi:hypothetical protein
MVNESGFKPGVAWDRRVQSPDQTIITSFACIKFEPDGDSRNMAALDNYSMRRTGWDCFWLDRNEINLEGIDFYAAGLEDDKAQDSKNPGVESEKGDSLAVEKPKDSARNRKKRWTSGTKLKVWVRRTLVYQLVNVGDSASSRYYMHGSNEI